jgi:prepilin-type N-terminal cleavage/methylation domain-containing protein
MKMRRRDEDRPRDGFTLVELLVAISIIVILASLIVVGIQGSTGLARGAIVRKQIAEIEAAQMRYTQELFELPPAGPDSIYYHLCFGEKVYDKDGNFTGEYKIKKRKRVEEVGETVNNFLSYDQDDFDDELRLKDVWWDGSDATENQWIRFDDEESIKAYATDMGWDASLTDDWENWVPADRKRYIWSPGNPAEDELSPMARAITSWNTE